MSNLEFKSQAASRRAADQQISVPALDHAAVSGAAARNAHSSRAVRGRYDVTRLAHPTDDGFRPFRVY
jgi:uncharacterized membrane protein